MLLRSISLFLPDPIRKGESFFFFSFLLLVVQIYSRVKINSIFFPHQMKMLIFFKRIELIDYSPSLLYSFLACCSLSTFLLLNQFIKLAGNLDLFKNVLQLIVYQPSGCFTNGPERMAEAR